MSIAMYIAIMAIVTYLIRALPFAFFRKKIKSKFIKSFLYYVQSPLDCRIPCGCLDSLLNRIYNISVEFGEWRVQQLQILIFR